MLLRLLAALALIFCAGGSLAATYESGDWAVSRIGLTCHLYSIRSARDTSGTLIFTFQQQGFNPSFTYEYAPWPNDTGTPPWSEGDTALLSIDDHDTWLGEEMVMEAWPGGGHAYMTTGFVQDALSQLLQAHGAIAFAVTRTALNETWLYGLFSNAGFADALSRAADWCQFDPGALPQS